MVPVAATTTNLSATAWDKAFRSSTHLLLITTFASAMRPAQSPAGELKHGPLALVDDDMPVVAVAPNNTLLKKLVSNIEEVHARGGELYVIADNEAEASFSERHGKILKLDTGGPFLAPVVLTIPLQLLAYHAAVARGTDVDQPRNLAKSVTVE